MSASDRPDLAAQITQITDPLIQMSKAKGDTNTLLVASLLENVLREAGPRQAEVLRRCAIPHWFDVGVLAVLREREDGNDRVLEKLRAYSFVRPVGPDRYAYHDQVRTTLLNEWQERDQAQLRALHFKLFGYFDTLCRSAGEQMAQQQDSLQPREMLAMGTWDLWRREAIYHLLNADAQRGLATLQEEVELLLRNHRLAEAEALLQMTDEVPLEREARVLVRFLTARLAQGALRLQSASDQLKALLSDSAVVGKLRAQVEQTLGEVYSETGQWVHATGLYRNSLEYWQNQANSASDDAARQRATRAVADVMLLLGDAYVGLASNTGGWYISSSAPTQFARYLVGLWEWLLGLPFIVIAWFLRRTRWQLPKPAFCAQYQNWLLIRLYRTAQKWFDSASETFESIGDQDGLIRANQQLARILLVYGYTDEAIQRFEQLLKLPQSQEPYRRSWLQRFLAEALLEKGEIPKANALLANALQVFRTVGDVRREAAVLALQGHAAALAGENKVALESYRSSLDRFRALHYVPARETILHDLRAWGRRQANNLELRAQIARVILAEPQKRYMARFPRTLLPLLQGASLLALPLALLLLAWVAPTSVVRVLAGDQPLSLGIAFDPLRALGVGVVLLPLYLASYAFLAMTVISFLPIGRIDREQPDYIVTSPEGIALYNRTGALEQHMGWSTIRRKFSLDRCIWTRPLPLYSRTFLEDRVGTDLRIDGITGWYTSLIVDIDQHLVQFGHDVEQQDLGYALLRSKSGVSCALAALFLLIYAGAENGYAGLGLIRLMPSFLYTIFGLLTLSGVLFLVPLGYWLARRPLKLQRALNLSDNWPWIVIITGAMPIMAFTVSTLLRLLNASMRYQTWSALINLFNSTTLIPILTYSTVLWGVYMIAEGVSALWFVGRPALRRLIVFGSLICSVMLLLPLLVPLFFDQWASAATRRAALLSDQRAGMHEVESAASAAYDASRRAYEFNPDPTNLINQGSAQFYAQRYDEALDLYGQAIAAAQPGSVEQALAYFNRSQAWLKLDDAESAQRDLQAAKMICNDSRFDNDAVCMRVRSWSDAPTRPLPSLGPTPAP